MSELSDQDKLERRKKRLQGLMGKVVAMAQGGEVEEPEMKEMDSEEDDFLSQDDEESEVEPDMMAKRKERFARLNQSKFGKKK